MAAAPPGGPARGRGPCTIDLRRRRRCSGSATTTAPSSCCARSTAAARSAPHVSTVTTPCSYAATFHRSPDASSPTCRRLQHEHDHWHGTRVERQPDPSQRLRARQLALSLLELGETVDEAERMLHRWRFHPAIAHGALRWAVAQVEVASS
ncbi:MAG: hypothetical protein R2690_13915 [Acidimicrobiales bacterium]